MTKCLWPFLRQIYHIEARKMAQINQPFLFLTYINVIKSVLDSRSVKGGGGFSFKSCFDVGVWFFGLN
jgi:hypothetical protein